MTDQSYFVVSNDSIKILNDQKDGKKKDWKGKKQRSQLMAEHLYHASEDFRKKAHRMEQCASVLTFNVTDQGLKLAQCYFCKGRLCPMCNWRRSLKIAFQNKKIVEVANERHNLSWIFLTLTVKNCEAEELKSTVDSMMKAWNRFAGYKKIKQSVKGWFRALEITKNTEKIITKKRYWKSRKYYDKQGLKPGDPNPNYGTYHPHFHVLICVTPGFFSGKNYIKQSEWVEFWRKAMRLDYKPVVDVRKVKPKKDVDFEAIENDVKEAIREQKAILEVSKYPVKDTDILPADKLTSDGIETVYTLETSLARKRLISYGGLLKELHKELNLDDAEDGDLIHTGEDETANAICEVTAYWHIGIKDYVIKEK